MISLRKVQKHLDELFLVKGIIDYCPNGLQIEGKQSIQKMATAVSASMETIEIAISEQVDLLIVHHGLFWQREESIIQGSKKNKISSLLQHEISLFAYHLPLDMHSELGNNWKAARELGWSNLKPFYIKGSPMGVIGEVNPCTREEFKHQLETYYKHSATCAWGGNHSIQTAALISGGAHKNIIEAAQLGVDAFITGSFDEPVWYQAKEEKINFYALGHSATERIGPIALSKYLQEALSCSCRFIDSENPF